MSSEFIQHVHTHLVKWTRSDDFAFGIQAADHC